MTPEKEEQLKNHLHEIAKILYQESKAGQMKTLEEIELTLKEQIQQYVAPQLGFFLFNKSVVAQKVESEN